MDCSCSHLMLPAALPMHVKNLVTEGLCCQHTSSENQQKNKFLPKNLEKISETVLAQCGWGSACCEWLLSCSPGYPNFMTR